MPSYRSNFTMVEMMIVIAILGIVAAIVIPFISNSGKAGEETLQYAREFAKNLPDSESIAVTCMDRDSNRDSYVSCTVFRKSKEPLAIECGYNKRLGWSNHGCRMQRPGGTVTRYSE